MFVMQEDKKVLKTDAHKARAHQKLWSRAEKTDGGTDKPTVKLESSPFLVQ